MVHFRNRLLFSVMLMLGPLACITHAQQIYLGVKGTLYASAVCDGAVYCGCDDGKLYVVNAADGTNLDGFPVDIGAAVEDGSYPSVRPGVYYGSLGKAIYVTTSKHGIVKVWPNGKIAWINKLDATSDFIGLVTPCVTPNGEVIAELKTLSTMYLVKLRETDGSVEAMSPALSATGGDVLTSPAVADNNVYVTVEHFSATDRKIFVLNLGDLTVKANLVGTGWEGVSPYVRGSGVFIGSSTSQLGTVFKFNSVTLAPDPLFGKGLSPNIVGATLVDLYQIGHLAVGISAAPRSADGDPGGTIYASLGNNLFSGVVAVDAVTGAVRSLSSSGDPEGGMVVSSRNVIAHCSGNYLDLWNVDGGSSRSYTLAVTPYDPVYDPTTNRFFVTTHPDSTGKSYLLGFDSP